MKREWMLRLHLNRSHIERLSLYLVVLLLCALLFPTTSFASTFLEDSDLTRDEIIRIAEAYKNHVWVAAEENIYHGVDLHRISVDTPDRDTFTGWPSWKGWLTGENTGIPYKWGGFSCIPESEYRGESDKDYKFDEGIEKGKYAGDMNCVEPSSQKYTVGVDCSGFVSRCWRLPRKQSTRSLPDISQPVTFEDLKKGDILNCCNAHVMLFKEFVTLENKLPGQTRIRIYHASGIDWKVSEWEYILKMVDKKEEEFRGVRYETNEVILEVVGRVASDGTVEPISTGYCDNHEYVPRTYFTERSVPFIETPRGITTVSCTIALIVFVTLLLRKKTK